MCPSSRRTGISLTNNEDLTRHYGQFWKAQRNEVVIPSFAAQKYRIVVASIVILMVGVIVSHRSLKSASEPQNVIHQLRIYEIFDSNKKAFHDRFRDHAMRIMAKYDFRIVATWESKKDDRTEFVYLLEWPDKETMADRWKKFLRDEEWIKIKRETGEMYGPLVGEIQDRTLYLKDYSPRKVLAK
jgi:NIPSNAP protein